MKILSVFLTLIFVTVLVQRHAAAQSIDRSLVCKDARFTVNNVGKRAILVVDVRYRPLLGGGWQEFPNTRNRVVEPGESVGWQRTMKGFGAHDPARAKVRYKRLVRDRWVPVRLEARNRVDAMCFDDETFFIFDVE